MEEQQSYRFPKREKLVSRRLMEQLFGGGRSRSASSFPLRLVYMVNDTGGTDASDAAATGGIQVLVTVSKRHFKRAVKRNRVKRQIREAWRLHASILKDAAAEKHMSLSLAFIWQADKLYSTATVEECVKGLLQRVAEKL